MNIVTDACCLINLIEGGCIETIFRLPDVRFFVGPVALEECARHRLIAEREIKAATLELIDGGDVPGLRFLDLLERYGLGQGETECIAICEHHGYTLGSDDQRARRIGSDLLSKERVIGTLGLLQRAVSVDRVFAMEAVAWVKAMQKAGSFLPPVDMNFFSGCYNP